MAKNFILPLSMQQWQGTEDHESVYSMEVPVNSDPVRSYQGISVGTDDLDFIGRYFFSKSSWTKVNIVFAIFADTMRLKMSRRMRRRMMMIQMSTR